MSKNGRGRGGSRGRGGTVRDEDPYKYNAETPLPLGSRIKSRVRVQSDESDVNLKLALEESLKTAKDEERARGASQQEEVGDQDGKTAPVDSKFLYGDVLSDDEDDKAIQIASKGSTVRFATRDGSSDRSKPPIIRRGKAQGAAASSKETSDARSAPWQSTKSGAYAASKLSTKSGSFEADRSAKAVTRSTDSWSAALGGGTATEPKPVRKTFAEAAARTSSDTAKLDATKSITQHLQRIATLNDKPYVETEVPPGTRFNPFTFQIEPKPDYKPLPVPAPAETKEFRVLGPHDFVVDNEGRPLDQLGKARAFTAYLDEMNRQVHQHNKTVITRPAQFVTYHEGEFLGSKRRNLNEGPLCEWLDRNFGDGLSEEQKKWVREHRAYMKECEEKKKKEAMVVGERSEGDGMGQ